MQKTKAYHFDQALKYHRLNKREFAVKSKIAYDTVTGWKRSGKVPDYAFVLLKQLAFAHAPSAHQKQLATIKYMTMTEKLTKEIQVAFWGKEYDPAYILKEVKRGNAKFVKPFFENIYHKEILQLLTTKNIEKLLPLLKKLFMKDTALFWENVVKQYNKRDTIDVL